MPARRRGTASAGDPRLGPFKLLRRRLGARLAQTCTSALHPGPIISGDPYKTSFWRDAQFDTIRLCLIKVAGRVTEMVTRIKIALPSAFPYQADFADLAGRIAKLPP